MTGSTLSQLARNLRNNATTQEKKLWFRFLRQFPLPIHRQYMFKDCIVDFYCHKAKSAIEIDGSQHLSPKGITVDAERTARLLDLGIEIIRFTNADIDHTFNSVCALIIEKIEDKIGSPLDWS